MNDVQTPPAAPAKGNPFRLIVLLLILAVAAVGLFYDYRVARPGIAKAKNTLEDVLRGDVKDPDGDGAFSLKEVSQLVGREPAEIVPIEGGKKAIYEWQSGMPFRKYRLYVAFEGNEEPLLYAISTPGDLRPDQLPPKNNARVRVVTEKEKAEFVPHNPVAAGTGPGAGGAEKGSDKKGRRPGKKRGKGGKGGKGGGRMSGAAPPTDKAADKGTETDTGDKSAKTDAGDKKQSPATEAEATKESPKDQPKTDEPAAKKSASGADTPSKTETKKEADKTPPTKSDAPPEKKDGAKSNPKK